MWLLILAAIGFVFGNGLFVYWLLFEFESLAAVWSNHLALAFIIDGQGVKAHSSIPPAATGSVIVTVVPTFSSLSIARDPP